MHLFHIPQCSIQNRNVHISVLNGALRVMEQGHSGICLLLNTGWWLTFGCDIILRYGSRWPEVDSPHKGPVIWKSSPCAWCHHTELIISVFSPADAYSPTRPSLQPRVYWSHGSSTFDTTFLGRWEIYILRDQTWGKMKFFYFVFSFKLDLWNCKIWLQCSVNQSDSTTILLSVSGVSKLVSYSVSESISQWVNQWVRQVGGCQSVSRSTWEDTEPITNTRAWEFSGFFLISGFFRAQKILKSIQIMQSFHILNKNIVKIVPWS